MDAVVANYIVDHLRDASHRERSHDLAFLDDFRLFDVAKPITDEDVSPR